MDSTRRRVLRGVSVGAALGVLGVPSTAHETDRVFVHPVDETVSAVVDAVETVDGTTVLEYDNFPFVVAEVPTEDRAALTDDVRVALVEDDDVAEIPSGWSPSIPDVLDPGGGDTDCDAHPEQTPSWGWERIGADGLSVEASDVDVGVLDTGIESDHCDLAVAGGRNFTDSGSPGDYEDRHGHGTHVAGIASALENDVGVVGVAPDANLHAVKVLGDDGAGRYSWIVAGIDWCLSNEIELISMSLGGESESATLDQAIEDAYEAGHLLLCSAGNEGNDGDGSCDEETMTYPATHDDVIAVSAMDEDDSLASYSSVGSDVEVLAPGTDIDSTYVDNEYRQSSGTSMACPFVTGVAALVWAEHERGGPGPNEEVRESLRETAETVLETCEEGYGLVDAAAAVDGDRAENGDDGEGNGDDDPENGDDEDDDGENGEDDDGSTRDDDDESEGDRTGSDPDRRNDSRSGDAADGFVHRAERWVSTVVDWITSVIDAVRRSG